MRTQGAKNKPKSIEKLVEDLKAQGVAVELIEGILHMPKGNSPDQKIQVETFELEPDLVGDTYKCGNCNATLDDAATVCPKCGVGLKWQE